MIRKTINTSVFLGLCMITLGMISPWMHEGNSEEKQSYHMKKTYLDPSQIHLDPAGIYIHINKTAKPQNALYHDEQGIFIQEYVASDIAKDHAQHAQLPSGDCAHPTCPYYYNLLDW